MVDAFLTSPVFGFVVLPILIFCARVCDMSLDTIRVIFMSKGIKYLPAIIGFFEIMSLGRVIIIQYLFFVKNQAIFLG